MKLPLALVLLVPFVATVAADRPSKGGASVPATAATRASTDAKPPPSKWVFELFPKAFQKNPLLDMTVFTEMTDAGRKLETPTREHPAYYESVATGYRQLGETIVERAPPPNELIHALTNALAAGGYFHADVAEHRPSILLVFHWGSHNKIDPTWAESDPAGALKNLIERARLVGGEPFAATLLKAYDDDASASLAGGGDGPSQVYLLSESSDTIRFLVDQSHEDIYFVVASAYDYAAAAGGKQVLLWRTTMTANTAGVSMKQTLPPLIANASPYFGHETTQAVPITKRGMQEGTVEIGVPTVIGIEEETAPPPPRDAAAAPQKP